MERDQVLELFKKYDAFLEGHFKLTSGLHSPHYFQCARVLQHPAAAEMLGRALGEKLLACLGGRRPDGVVSPALGGVIIGHELGRFFGVRAIFAERQQGQMQIRRFDLARGESLVVVEDVVTTGGSLLETAKAAEQAGAEIVALCCLVDRSGPGVALGRPLTSLAKVEVVNHQPENCPFCSRGIPLVKPGSRPEAQGGAGA